MTTREQGVDWSKFQGNNGVFAYSTDKFVICQIGGTYGGSFVDQVTYNSQVASAGNHGLRAHTYIWFQIGNSKQLAKSCLDYYLPKVKTPKGSIVALDYEDGASSDLAGNTEAILYGMRRINDAGYTPMYYSYKPYTLKNVDYKRIIAEFPDSLWIAEYPDYNVRSKPDYNYFPTMDGVAIFQFTSMYIAGGLDGNVDLTGITYNGYKQANTISNVVTVKTGNGNPTAMFNSKSEAYATTPLTNGSKWKADGIIADKDGEAMFKIGNNSYVRQDCTNLNDLLVINYSADYGVNAYDKKGKMIKDSNLKFKGGSKWEVDNKLTDIPNVGLCYQVSTDEFIPAKYQVGSGFKG